MADLVGKTIANYRIDAALKTGGMGAVYKATQVSNGGQVAFKVMLPGAAEDAGLVDRFKREAMVLRDLKHANIIDVYDYGVDTGVLYMVMPFMDRGTLGDLMRKQPLSKQEILKFMTQISDALAYVHGKGLVHRDLKAANVLLDDGGNCKVCDFGLVSVSSEMTKLTKTGVIMGSAAYMAPEQCNGRPVDARTDIYAMGIMLYEMLTGRLPFSGDSWSAIALQQMNQPPPAPDTGVKALDSVVLRALAKNPGQRQQTAAQFSSELAAAIGGRAAMPVLGSPADQTRRSVIKLAAGAGILAAGGVAAAWAFSRRAGNSTEIPALTATSGRPTPTLLAATDLPTTRPSPPPPSSTPASTATDPSPVPTASALRPSPTAVANRVANQTVRKIDADRIGVMLAPGLEMALVRIPAGEFIMGSDKAGDPQAYPDELPKHRLTLREYWMGKTDVTNAQFAAFVKATNYPWSSPANTAAKQNHPVVNVSWYDSLAFCEWARELTDLPLSLPGEAHWEMAARGPDGRVYPWGNQAPDATRLNFANNIGDTTAVGKYDAQGASPFGLDDMAGNVWQWTLSEHRGYPYGLTDGRDNENKNSAVRVLRGGSFDLGAKDVRCACRGGNIPSSRYNYFGFRVCVPPSTTGT